MTGSAYRAQFCGGTLLSDHWVLTAAHCVVNEEGVHSEPAEISVLAGSDNLEYPNFEPIAVTRIVTHEDYRSTTFGDDIALLKLAEPAPATAALLNEKVITSDQRAYIAGWGWLDYAASPSTAERPRQLQMAQVRTLTAQDCTHAGGQFAMVEHSKQFCAEALIRDGSRENQASTCFGDSGGPIYTIDNQNMLRLAGISSLAAACGRLDLPGIYTNVLHYSAWISQQMDEATTISSNMNNSNSGNDDTTNRRSANAPVSTQPEFQRLTATGSTGCVFLPLLFVMLFLRSHTRLRKCQ